MFIIALGFQNSKRLDSTKLIPPPIPSTLPLQPEQTVWFGSAIKLIKVLLVNWECNRGFQSPKRTAIKISILLYYVLEKMAGLELNRLRV